MGNFNTRIAQLGKKTDALASQVNELNATGEELLRAIMRRDRDIAAIGRIDPAPESEDQ
ncbi:MAG: hypothetical protein WBX25_15680 [Rhodomicrobium sp.]